MERHAHRVRRHTSLAVSVALVIGMGLVGLWAGHAAGSEAESTHRSDRLALQTTLAELTGQYTQVAGAEIMDIVTAQSRAGAPAWTGHVGSAADVRRLRVVAEGSRALDAGAVLVGPEGTPVSSYTPAGHGLPLTTDPGLRPLAAALTSKRRTLPVSGVLDAAGTPVVAVAIPVQLASGATGLIVGLSDLRHGALQRYTARLAMPDGRRGYVIDGRGLVIAAPVAAEVGLPLRFPHARAAALRGAQGVKDAAEGDKTYTLSYARAGDTGWVALTVQDTDLFLGPLRRSALRAELALVILLLIAGSSLLMLHRNREGVLRDVALTDELTGLYNRRGWFAVAAHEIERARRSGERRGLLFIDLDGLKHVNDALGHREGDRALADAADVLRGCARASDVLGRLGGDEFVLLLAEEGAPDGVRDRVLAALDAHNARSGARFELRMSIGAEVWYPDDAPSLDELVRRADRRMYDDKAARPMRHEGLVRPPAPVG